MQRTEAARRAEQATQEQLVLAELDDLPADAPLERWLPFTRVAGMPAVTARAEAAIHARPDLMQELAAALRSADYRTRTLALGFVHDDLIPPLPDGLIAPVREALTATAAFMRAQVEAHFDLRADEFYPACLLAVDLPDRFPGHAADFAGPIREMRAVFDGLPPATAPMGRQELDDWLHSHAPDRPR
ncbi:MAG: hypothetical protein INR65_18150 [Gluconacetobacter diazotrophicus]|nr:hypothetical protein [Gluconacetobacter diazotrophicus]